MSRTIAIANQKGGVGKTTTAVNLSAALASLGKRTLLIDLDPQGNATMGCGVDKYEIEAGIFEVLVDAVPISEVRLSVAAGSARAGGVNHLVAANSDLTAAEIELMSLERREQRLREALAAVDAEYDYTLIDCPPSLNILTLNAFVAADSVLVPIQCEYYALEGLSALLDTIEGVRESVNPALTVEGLLRTMYDGRNNLGAEVSAQLIEQTVWRSRPRPPTNVQQRLMAKRPRMGRNLNALLGGSPRERNGSGGDSGSEVVTQRPADSVSPSKEAEAPEPTPQPTLVEAPPAAVSSVARVAPGLRSVPAAVEPEFAAAPSPDAGTQSGDRLRTIGIDQIRRGAYQPRRHFDDALLQELADSLKAQGLIQPILVRERDGGYELIAGERRWRAAQLAGLHEIPAIVRELEDIDVASVSLIENIQRKDLNPLEEAAAFKRLCTEFSMTHQEVAESVGRSRVAVSNMMRLLDLHDDVKSMVDQGDIEMGNARALLGAPLDEQPELAARIVKQRLTTRAVEKLVRDLREGKAPQAPEPVSDPDISRLAERLGGVLGAPVQIKHRPNGAGRLEIRYTSVEELEGILGHIN